MITHVTIKVMINLKLRKCKNSFKPLIKESIKKFETQPVFQLMYAQ